MNETRVMVRDMAERLFGDGCGAGLRVEAERGVWPVSLWRRVEEAGLPLLAVPEALGGAGMSLADAMVLAHVAGRHAAPVPLMETVLGNWLLASAGLKPLRGPIAVPVRMGETARLARAGSSGWTLSGRLRHVPWGEEAGHLVLVAQRESGGGDVVLAMSKGQFVTRGARSVAFEPRSTLRFDDVIVADDAVQAGALPSAAESLLCAGALARCCQMAGAMEWLQEQTIAWAKERSQFGKSIGGFQAVQHMVAVMAAHACAATAAAGAASLALGSEFFEEAVAMAKARVGEASAEVAATAHQVHGAMGYCQEYPLHYRTKRLWSWRDEFGSEREWQVRIGRKAMASGGIAFWPGLTAIG